MRVDFYIHVIDVIYDKARILKKNRFSQKSSKARILKIKKTDFLRNFQKIIPNFRITHRNSRNRPRIVNHGVNVSTLQIK